MTQSVAIKHAHDPRRLRFVAAITARYPEAVVIRDRGLGLWDTARRAWESAIEIKSEYHLVLDDDVILPAAFDLPVGDRVLALCHPWPGGALCMPSKWIPDFLAWCDEHVREDYRHDDGRLHLWAHRTGREVRRLSLVEHVGKSHQKPSLRPDMDRAWRHARRSQENAA